ncbi:MAG: hypothetical protein ACXVHB_19550 [Solirubrobacteraceae bacterium]
MKGVCILHRSHEDLDHAWLLICQDDLCTAVGATALLLMTLEHQDIEAIAHRVVELLETPPRKLLTVAEVARLLAVDRGFVYAHQAELGVVRLPGKGRRPALRFDRDTLLERLDRSHATQAHPPPDERGGPNARVTQRRSSSCSPMSRAARYSATARGVLGERGLLDDEV